MKVVVTCMVLVAAVAVARADERERARKHFREASQHYKLGEFSEALQSFKEAYRAFEDPSLLFNIAQCQRQLNLKQDAIRTYRAYLHDVPNAPERADVQNTIAALDDALAREQAATSSPPQGTLGAPPESSPAPRTPAPGTARSDLVAPAHGPRQTPVYKKWWLWTIVGAVAVGGAVALGVTLAPGPAAPGVSTSNGTLRPF
jgi:hypothetical protein